MLNILLLVPLLGGPAPALATDGSAASAPQEHGLYAILHDADTTLRDRLVREAEIWFDGGDLLIGALANRTVESLAASGVECFAIGLPDMPEDLWVVSRTELERLGDDLSGSARTLLDFERGEILALPAGVPPAAESLLGDPHQLVRVGRRAIQPQTSSRLASMRVARAPDPRIQALVDQVSSTNMINTATSLSALFNRRADTANGDTARDMIALDLQGFGLTTSYESFSTTYSENVVAEITGQRYPNEYIVIGGHYDSTAGGSTSPAPGADDNASGTAGVIEAARIFASAGPFERTIRFMAFSAEEMGLIGSRASAANSKAAGEDIVAMLNLDMSAYRSSGDARTCDYVTNNSSPWLITLADSLGTLYVPSWASNTGSLFGGTSDHEAYFDEGFPAMFFFEDVGSYSPYIHSASDTMALSAIDFVLAQMIVRDVVATAATLAEPLDLEITHTPLPDMAVAGPYTVQADVTSLVGSNVTAVELHYSDDGGASYTPVAMSSTGGATYEAQIPHLGSPLTILYYITASDDASGSETLPEGADWGDTPFSFFVGSRTIFYATGFDGPTSEGWTHGAYAGTDDWTRGTPQGAGGDPSGAYSGAMVWGNDLSSGDGEYDNYSEPWLRSPAIDCSAATGVILSFQRWLGVEDGIYDQAEIYVDGALVWVNPSGSGSNHLIDTSWVPFELDITSQAAGDPSVTVEFRIDSDSSVEFSGWNIDDFELVQLGPIPAAVEIFGCGVNPANSMTWVSGTPAVGQQFFLGIDNPLGTQAVGSVPILAISMAPDAHYPCGTVLPGWGMSGNGELLVSLIGGNLQPLKVGSLWTGAGNPVSIAVNVPNDPSLAGVTAWAQGLMFDPTIAFGVKFGLTEGAEIHIGP